MSFAKILLGHFRFPVTDFLQLFFGIAAGSLGYLHVAEKFRKGQGDRREDYKHIYGFTGNPGIDVSEDLDICGGKRDRLGIHHIKI